MSDEPPKLFISYSHDSDEHRNWVLQLATRLRSNGVDVILDQWNLALGSNLSAFMEQGLSQSHRVLCICTENYAAKANQRTGGVGYESQIMSAEYLGSQNLDWVIPLVRTAASPKPIPAFLAGRIYSDFSDEMRYEASYEDLLRNILGIPVLPIPQIGVNPFLNIQAFAEQQVLLPNSERYYSPAPSGTVTFDYSNNNGRYTVGGELLFEIAFSKASNQQIYVYTDPPSIRALALAKGVNSFEEINDAREYDFSSRTRTPRQGQVVILQNANGYYAAVRIISLKDDTRGSEHDEVKFEYVIQTNGSPDFRTTGRR